MKKYEVDGRIFGSEEEAVQYCAEELISTANITEIETEEEATIEENPEEDVDFDSEIEETEVLDEVTLIEKLATNKALETFGEWDETAKAEILQQALRITDKSRDKPARLKGLPKKETIENYIESKYRNIVENLADLDATVCPLCNREWSKIAKDTEDLTTQHSKLEGRFPKIRIHHIKTEHPTIYQFLKIMFKVPKEMPHVAEPYSSNPESCSDLEELSKEELAEEISRNPELRNQLFKKWQKAKKSK